MCSLHPHPWRVEPAPYYVVEGLDNSDGHGGYASICRFDREGLPYLCTSKGRDVYHPLVIARYVLRMLSLSALTGDENAHAAAERAAVAFGRSGVRTGVWRPGASADDMSGDRPSCIIQGTAISALARVERRNPGIIPQDVLRLAVQALVGPAGKGGTVTYSPEGPFLQEFNSLSHVLNGCVYALWALYDLIDGLGQSNLTPLSNAVESCLALLAPRFTTSNGWSLYALNTYGHAPLASIHYHRSHIRMLKVLNARTGQAAYRDAVARWESALNSRSIRCVVLARKCAQVVWMRDIRRLPLVHSVWDGRIQKSGSPENGQASST